MLFINLEIYGIFIIRYILRNNLFLDEEYNRFFKNRDLNFWIEILVLVVYLIVVLVELNYKFSLNLLFFSLLLIIIVRDFLVFFSFYEIIFILIIFVIVLLGYNYERLIAAFLIIFYSFLFSRPSLIIILLFDLTFLIKNWLRFRMVINYFLVASFIVKFPIFGFHYWLPIAHVEASTVGSMILAGVLLKLGSLGLFYVVMYLKLIVKFHWLILGVLLSIVVILFLSDLKIMIAYPSVAHMTLVFYVIILGSNVGKKGSLIIIFFHGFISPLMFWVVGILVWYKTRSLIVVKMISFPYVFLLILFFLLILNIGFPPFIGFLREILILKSLYINKLILTIIIFIVLFRCYYNVYSFWCFNNFIGVVFKDRIYYLDTIIFILLSLILNIY